VFVILFPNFISNGFASLLAQSAVLLYFQIRWLKPTAMDDWQESRHCFRYPIIQGLCADVRVHSIHCRWLLQIFQFKSIAVGFSQRIKLKSVLARGNKYRN